MKFSSTFPLNSKLNFSDLLTLRRNRFTPQERALLPLVQKNVFASGPVRMGAVDLAQTAFRTLNNPAPIGMVH